MDFWVILGAIGSVASVVAIFVPLQTQHQRVVHVAYSCAIAMLSAVAVWYWYQNTRIRSVERAATALVSRASFDYTDQGFILASLAFLEKNKDLYPDAYSRAHNMCLNNECISPRDSMDVVRISFAFKGLLRGIAAIEGGP